MIGLRELALVALVVLVLYGRSGVVKSRQFQTILPWISPTRRNVARSQSSRAAAVSRAQPVSTDARSQKTRAIKPPLLKGNRLFWFMTVLAATAVAAWVITHVMIARGAGPGAGH
jgi:hypothetical protein